MEGVDVQYTQKRLAVFVLSDRTDTRVCTKKTAWVCTISTTYKSANCF
jgi:hypothetical protein